MVNISFNLKKKLIELCRSNIHFKLMKGHALHDLKNKIQLKEHNSDNIYDDNKT